MKQCTTIVTAHERMYYYLVTKTPAWCGVETLGNMARQYRWVTPVHHGSPVNGTPPCRKQAPTRGTISKISGVIGATMSAASKKKEGRPVIFMPEIFGVETPANFYYHDTEGR